MLVFSHMRSHIDAVVYEYWVEIGGLKMKFRVVLILHYFVYSLLWWISWGYQKVVALLR